MSVKNTDTSGFYDEVKSLYSWRNIAQRTERVYDHIMEQPILSSIGKIKSALSIGPIIGLWSIFYTIFELFVIYLSDFFS